MDLIETARTCASADDLFALVCDLGSYPAWLRLVVKAVPDGEASVEAWLVELRGRIGPFTRSKRLRMVRTSMDRPRNVRFERVEIDGRSHADWVLEIDVRSIEEGSELTMALHYGGTRFAPVLAPILRDEIRKGRRALQERFEG